jgi:hypothetical protein
MAANFVVRSCKSTVWISCVLSSFKGHRLQDIAATEQSMLPRLDYVL